VSNFVGHLQVSSAHVYSAALKLSHLDLCNQVLSNTFVEELDEAKAPTGLGHRISNDLEVLHFPILREVVFKVYILHLVIKTTHKHLVPDGSVFRTHQLTQFFVVATLVKSVLELVASGLLSPALPLLLSAFVRLATSTMPTARPGSRSGPSVPSSVSVPTN